MPLNENSGNLFSLGADFLGSAIARTDEDKQLFSGAGKTIGNILQTRFYDKQADDFMNNEMLEFQKASESYQNMMAAVDFEKDPNGLKRSFDDWRNKVVDPFVYKMSTRYGRNEKIMRIVTDVQNKMNAEMGEFIKFDKAAGEAEARPGEREKTAQEKDTLAAQAEYYRAQANNEGKEGRTPETEYEKRLAKMPIPPWANPYEQRYFANQPSEVWENVDKQTNELLADRLVKQLKEQNAVRPDNGKTWGETSNSQPELGITSDKEYALQELVKKSANYTKAIEAGRVRTAGPHALYMHDGYYDDVMGLWEGGGSVLLPEEKARATQLRGNQDASTILAVITGSNKNNFQGLESVKDYADTIENMESPAQLGGPIATTFESALRYNHGVLVDTKGRRIKTYADIKEALMDNYNDRVISNLIADEPGSAKTKQEAILLGQMAIDKFAKQLADKHRIEVPASELDKAVGTTLTSFGRYLLKRGAQAKEAAGKLLPDREEVEIR